MSGSRLFLIAEEQLASLASAREVPLKASAEILGCRNLALVLFEGLDDKERAAGEEEA